MTTRTQIEADRAYAYPDLLPYKCESVPMDARHTLWVEQSGCSNGVPVIALHGGPGVPLEPSDRRLFDPEHYRLIQFDQRGVGRSRPHADLTDNSLWHTVEDMERLRLRYGIERWIVTGHSYGSTIALAYAKTYPERCQAVILRGVYTATPAEGDWIVNSWKEVWPEAWEETLETVGIERPENYYSEMLTALDSEDRDKALAAAVAYSKYELHCCYSDPEKAEIDRQLDPADCWANARIATHYAAHDDFLEPGQLLRDLHRLRDVPCYLLTGRFDVVTPPGTAHRLAKALQAHTKTRLTIVPMSAHMSTEPGNIVAMTRLMNEIRDEGRSDTCDPYTKTDNQHVRRHES